MSYVINLYVSDIKSINRTVVVNDNISIQLFVKSLILSVQPAFRICGIFGGETLQAFSRFCLQNFSRKFIFSIDKVFFLW